MYSDKESIFYMCDFIFEKDIEALEKELKDEEKQKFHFDNETGKISWGFKRCLLILTLPNTLHDIFSITLSAFRKLPKKDVIKKQRIWNSYVFLV